MLADEGDQVDMAVESEAIRDMGVIRGFFTVLVAGALFLAGCGVDDGPAIAGQPGRTAPAAGGEQRETINVGISLYLLADDKQDPDAIARHTENLKGTFSILDAHLADRAYITGDTFTMGDIATGAFAWRYLALEIEKPELPHLSAWFERLKDRPAYREHVMLPLT